MERFPIIITNKMLLHFGCLAAGEESMLGIQLSFTFMLIYDQIYNFLLQSTTSFVERTQKQ